MDCDCRSLICVLTRDHRRIVDLIMRLPMIAGEREGRRLVDELTGLLIRHAVAEDLFLYPAVGEIVPRWAVNLTRETGAHARIEQLLADLAEAKPHTLSSEALVSELLCEVDRETLHEELDVFPWLRHYGDAQLLDELGDKIQAFKNTAVIEKISNGGLTIRLGEQVLHHWHARPGPDAPTVDRPPARRRRTRR